MLIQLESFFKVENERNKYKQLEETKKYIRINNKQPFYLKQYEIKFRIINYLFFFMIIGLCFLLIGLIVNLNNQMIWDLQIQYGDCQYKVCKYTFRIDKEIKGPIYIYYQIDNFYQNHRNYIEQQKIVNQLRMINKTDKQKIQICGEYSTNEQMNKKYSYDNHILDPKSIARPCGFQSFHIFNDTCQVLNEQIQQNVDINRSGLVSVDNSNATQWIDIESDQYIIWMQISSFGSFMKLYGRIEQSLQIGKYSIIIDNNWDVTRFQGQKYFYISETSFIGGRNYFLAYFMFLASLISFVIAIIFSIIQYKTKSKYL